LIGYTSELEQKSIPMWHWVDSNAIGRDSLKFWQAANDTVTAIVKKILNLIQAPILDRVSELAAGPFEFACPQKNGLRLEMRRDYNSLEVGFSPNDHDEIRMVGYPLVELLAVIGLQHARPLMSYRREKLPYYRYGVWGAPVPTLFARAMLGLANPGFPIRSFSMQLGWANQEGKALYIKNSLEDTPS
jgi:CRISPR-associated protein Csb3